MSVAPSEGGSLLAMQPWRAEHAPSSGEQNVSKFFPPELTRKPGPQGCLPWSRLNANLAGALSEREIAASPAQNRCSAVEAHTESLQQPRVAVILPGAGRRFLHSVCLQSDASCLRQREGVDDVLWLGKAV